MELRRTTWDDPAAVALRDAMDAEVGPRYADRAATMSEAIAAALTVDPATVLLTLLAVDDDGTAVGHAALRRREDAPQPGDVEVKRVVVAASARGQGVADALMGALEAEARALGAPRVVLQTGDRQADAERLYVRRGYVPIPVFPPYEAVTFSRCYAKALTS